MGDAGDVLLLDESLSILWTLVCSFFVVYMQSGFALLEAGAVRAKNVKNILLKNVIDICVSILCWYAVGYAFAYGSCGENAFIGHADFFSSDNSMSGGVYWARWIFRWTFSATAATIVAGAVAERAQLKSYALWTALCCGFLYPVVVHWVWSSSGWLSPFRQGCGEVGYSPYFSRTNGLMDFAGSGTVHMLGGGAALMGAIMLGPRLGRFLPEPQRGVAYFEPASPTNMVLGAFSLWVGWYGFNAGSARCFLGCMDTAAKVAVNTTLSVGASTLTSLLLAVVLGEAGDVVRPLNGILAGGVSITAGCALVQEYAAVVIGIGGALVYTASSKLLLRLRIDDPLDASPVHFFCGMWGLLAPGFFATQTSTEQVYTYARDWGVFYGGQGYQLGVQVLGVVVIAAWTCCLSGAAFWLLHKADWLRVSREMEVNGLDYTQGLLRQRTYKLAAAVRGEYADELPLPRDSERAQHGSRDADIVLHGRPSPTPNGHARGVY
ncbi:hypothetical protein N2152v2_005305 [Parachlorella kessleri]